jgi:carbamate kinase
MECYLAALELARPVARLAASGTRVVVCCDAAPLLDEALTQSLDALARGLMVEVDQTLGSVQGRLGYSLVQALDNELRVLGSPVRGLSVAARTRVDIGDPSFFAPSRALGPVLSQANAEQLRDMEGWSIIEVEGGWQRVVASPPPVELVELDIVRHLLDLGVVPVLCGGGIPVVHDERALLMGVCALVEMEATASLLRRELHAQLYDVAWDETHTELCLVERASSRS